MIEIKQPINECYEESNQSKRKWSTDEHDESVSYFHHEQQKIEFWLVLEVICEFYL